MTTVQAQKKWHVVYTRSRAEKKVIQELSTNKIECFLPLQKRLRQWKDRKKWVETPLIPGYCFVNITRKDYDKVLQLNNVVHYITFEGKAAIVSQQEIDVLRTLLQQFDFNVDVTTENFKPGKLVEIIEGPMIGLKGELIESRGKNKFALRIEQIETSFMVEIPANYLSALPETII
ncbi:UpxY family transcription antiterminator [Draconibacterium sp. IB214405]|uniref:UpxY family transcription antiterminator n=1 Tax=Draconibacterium sp. IB214405 TaxID=3097352 RepID=UPI002A1738A2|nr:UpxY family transcription antiterminator [Draconibacterium sp. IB214405]MDX8339314.1 UpxY family transcription antiterminator [Draconibacterium sp. IB214405]